MTYDEYRKKFSKYKNRQPEITNNNETQRINSQTINTSNNTFGRYDEYVENKKKLKEQLEEQKRKSQLEEQQKKEETLANKSLITDANIPTPSERNKKKTEAEEKALEEVRKKVEEDKKKSKKIEAVDENIKKEAQNNLKSSSFGESLKKSTNYIENLDQLQSDLNFAGVDMAPWMQKLLSTASSLQATEKTYLNNVETATTNAVSGVAKDELYISKRNDFLGKLLSSPLSQTAKIKPDAFEDTIDKAESFAKRKDEENQKNSLIANQEKTPLGKTIGYVNDNIAPTIGQMTPAIITSAATGGNSSASAIVQAFVSNGSYYRDAEERGMNEDEAFLYSKIMAGVEAGTEYITASNAKKTGTLFKNITNGNFGASVKEVGFKKALAKLGEDTVEKGFFKSIATDALENAFQEAITEPINEIVAGTVADKADWSNMGERMLNSAINGGIVAVIMGGANAGVPSAQNVKTTMQENIKNGKDATAGISSQEVQKAYNDTSKVLDTDAMMVDSVKQQGTKLQSLLVQNNISAENTQSSTESSAVQNNQQVFQYEETKNQKVNNLAQDFVNIGLNNSEQSHNLFKTYSSIIERTDSNIRLNPTITDEQGNAANGRIYTKNGENYIEVNPNSERSGEFILMHELSHGTINSDLKQFILDYANTVKGKDEAIKSLEQVYKTGEITDETVCDISAQLLGNEEYINKVINQKPSTFMKIYNAIKSWAKKFTGTYGYEDFVRDIEYKWQKAFEQNRNKITENIKNKTLYSFAGEKAQNANITNLDIAKEMVKKGIAPEEVFQKTGWYQGNEGKWRFELDDYKWNLKDIKNMDIDNKLLILEDILDAPELYEAYPEARNLPVIFDKKMKSGTHGQLENALESNNILDSNSIYTIRLNPEYITKADAKSYDMLGLKNQSDIYSTLQHEIQHWIQYKEDFSKGSNPQSAFNERNTKEQESFLNTLGTKEELSKKYDFNTANDIRFYLRRYLSDTVRIFELTNSIIESKNKLNILDTEKQNMYQEGIKRSERFIKDTKQWQKDTAKEIENIVGEDGLRKVEKANEKYLDFLYHKENLAYDLYKNTAGEQEARDVQDRIKLKSEEKKVKLPFIKDENTVYTNDSNISFSISKDLLDSTGKLKSFKEQLKDNKFNRKSPYIVSEDSMGITDNNYPIALKSSVIKKAEEKHNISKAELYDLPEKMKNYTMVTKSQNRADSIIVFIDQTDNEGRPIMVSMALDKKMGTYDINDITSIYGRNNGKTFVEKLINDGRVLKQGKKMKQWLTSIGVQFSKDIATASSNNSIPQNTEKVKDNKGRALTQNQQEYFKNSKVKDENGNLLTMYHSTDAEFNTFTYDNIGKTGLAYGQGFYFTDSEQAKNAYGKNTKTVYLNIEKPMQIGERTMSKADYQKLVEAVNKETNGQVEADYGSIQDALQDYEYGGDDIDLINGLKNESGLSNKVFYKLLRETLGYDGIKANNVSNGQDGNYWIAFNSNQIKNIDNKNPTNNPDIRYSKQSMQWQQWLEENFPSRGTTTKFSDIRLPTKQDITTQKNTNNNSQSKVKSETRSIQEDLVTKNKQLYKQRYKLEKEAQRLDRKIELTDNEKGVVKSLLNGDITVDEIPTRYNKENIIQKYKNDKQLNEVRKEIKRNKQEAKQVYNDTAQEVVDNLSKFKDKSKGILYRRETAIRNIQDVVKDKVLADKINSTYFKPVLENEAERTRYINENAKKINDLKIDTKTTYPYANPMIDKNGRKTIQNLKINEADVAGLYLENKVDEEYFQKNNINKSRIEEIANTFKSILDDGVDRMETEVMKAGYAPIGRIENYFPHFIETRPDGFIGKITNFLGIRTKVQNLPTEIAGKTDTFRPGKTWNQNTLHREGQITDINALQAMEKYINGASDVIYHTDDIQKLRALERNIRQSYTDDETLKTIENIRNNNELTDVEKEEAIYNKLQNVKTEIPNFVTWLTEYTNILANKKSQSDRSMEYNWGRSTYSTMQDIESKIASNMIGGNLSVSLTNFAPLAQCMGTTKVGNVLVGMLETTKNTINETFGRGDGFVDASDFLTRRRGTETIHKQKAGEKLSNVLGKPMQLIDNFTSEAIVRAKYRENIQNGMTEIEAIKSADEYSANLMADRSKGAQPTLFNSKNPVSKLITMFQIEPNNMISNYTKDWRNYNGNKAFAVAKLTVASYAFNTILKSIRGGSDILPDPINIVSNLIKMLTAKDEEDKKKAEDEMISSVTGSLPFGSSAVIIANALGIDVPDSVQNSGRMPVASAVPSIGNIIKGLKSDSKDYRNQQLTKELVKPLLYLGLPTGGAQINKTIQGLKAYEKKGSYKYNSKGEKILQFPVQQNVTNLLKSITFGKYATKEGQEYATNFDSFNAKQTQLYDDTDIEYNDLKKYFKDTKNIKEDIKKMNYIDNMQVNDDDKIKLYKYNILSEKQAENLDYAIKNNLTTKSTFDTTYKKLEVKDVNLPTKDDLVMLKNNNIPLSTYSNYKIATKGMKTEQEKNTALLNLNCKAKTKQAIYENTTGKDDKTYNAIKNVISIDTYLDYKTQQFEADKDSEGKSISGSKKAKIINYVNSKTDLKYEEKLLLVGINNKLSVGERNVLYNYIDSQNLTAKQKLAIYSKLQGFTVKNNYVSF